MARTTACASCGGSLLTREVFCRHCRVGCCSVACEAAHIAAAHPQSAATVYMAGAEPTPPDSIVGLAPGTRVRVPSGGHGVVLRSYPDRGTVRVLYRLGEAELDGLFTPDELTPLVPGT